MDEKTKWPVDEPWWQHTPRTLATGYLSLGVAALLIVTSGIALLRGGLDVGQTVLFAITAVCGVALLFQSSLGVKKLLRYRNQRR